MNKYNNPRLLNAVVSGTGMKHPMQPHVVVGDVSNGFIRGDLMDANAIVELINSDNILDEEKLRTAISGVIGLAPENLDTLGEIADTMEGSMKNLTVRMTSTEVPEEQSIVLLWNAFYSDPVSPNNETVEIFNGHNYNCALEIPVATAQHQGLMSTADKAALGAASSDIEDIKQIIEDNELTTAAALNDLNSRVKELEPEEETWIAIPFAQSITPPVYNPTTMSALFGYIKDDTFFVKCTHYVAETNTYPIDPYQLYQDPEVWPILLDSLGYVMQGKAGPVYTSGGLITLYMLIGVLTTINGRFKNVINIQPDIETSPTYELYKKVPKFENFFCLRPGYTPCVVDAEFIINAYAAQMAQPITGAAAASATFKIQVDGEDITKANTYMFTEGKHNVRYITNVQSNSNPILLDSQFADCGEMTSVNLPYTLSAIPTRCFYNCIGLTSVFIPKTVQTIKTKAFQGCSGLQNITLDNAYGRIVALDDIDAFDGCTSLESIYVSPDVVDAYKNDNKWSTYANLIKPIPEE